MGETFLYVNLDREEYLDAGLGIENSKLSGLGKGLAARALGLLLLKIVPENLSADGKRDHLPPVGNWAGNRVHAVGDFDSDLYLQATASFRCMNGAATVMLFRSDERELLDRAAHDDELLVLLGELATTHGQQQIDYSLTAAFGKDWRKRFFDQRSRSTIEVSPP